MYFKPSGGLLNIQDVEQEVSAKEATVLEVIQEGQGLVEQLERGMKGIDNESFSVSKASNKQFFLYYFTPIYIHRV